MTDLRPAERPIRVLVVDAEPALRRLLCVVMRAGAFQTLEAASVTEALWGLAPPATPPDVIVLDLVLADAQGLDVLRRIRQHPVLARVPVVVLTGRVSDAARKAVLEAGADAFEPMPFDGARLRQLVQRLARDDGAGRRRQPHRHELTA